MNLNFTKKVSEVSYLTADNHAYYRYILRFFFQEHNKLHYLLAPEEIYTKMSNEPFFKDYTLEDLQNHLTQLVKWNNLVAQQDAKKANTIEEFKQKRYLYQCTPYTIAIERMLDGLEGMVGYGGSLEPKFFDKLVEHLLLIINNWQTASDEDVHFWWDQLMNDFEQLSNNAADYLAHLQSPKVEKMMMTTAFLVFKDKVTEKLRKFMKSLQHSFFRMEGILLQVTAEQTSAIINKVCIYEEEQSLTRIDEDWNYNTYREQKVGEWKSFKTWFLGNEDRQSDIEFLQNTTNNTIRKITRFAIRLSESIHGVKSRKQDYLRLAKMFSEVNTLDEAHLLSAATFGVAHTQHIYSEIPKSTERIDLSAWQEPADEVILNPRIRAYRPRTRSNPMTDHREEREALREEYIQQRKYEQELMDRFIRDGGFEIKDLPVVEPLVRKTILRWLDRANSKDKKGKTEDGRMYQINVPRPMEWTILECTDGKLKMPNYQFLIREVKESK